jgi:hypothetical protein
LVQGDNQLSPFKPLHMLIGCLALMLSGIASAAQPLQLTNQVFVERSQMSANGRSSVVLSTAEKVLPGDQLVFVLRYVNPNDMPSDRLIITNEMPSAVVFQHASKGAVVSIDGGKNWGVLTSLTVAERDGRQRSARPEDVTHVRWQFAQPVPAGGVGRLTFRGIAR